MKYQILTINMLLLGLSPQTLPRCLPGNPQSSAYIRRDNNRCEGLLERNVNARFDLISLSTGKLSSYPTTLNIRVPLVGKTAPNLQVQSRYRNYLLNEVNLLSSTKGFSFPLKTDVLKKTDIPSNTLRAIAYINSNGQITYFPVILEGVSGKYEFVVYSPQPRTFRNIEIRYKGKALFKESRKIPQKGQIIFTWNYGNAPTGNYELYLKDDQNQSYSFRFQHNPNLL